MKVSAFEGYKAWVRGHPGIVQNLDWLLYLVQWNPGRLSPSSSTELGYEAYHAAVGLLSVWHSHILEQGETRRSSYSHALELIEQVCADPALRSLHLIHAQ